MHTKNAACFVTSCLGDGQPRRVLAHSHIRSSMMPPRGVVHSFIDSPTGTYLFNRETSPSSTPSSNTSPNNTETLMNPTASKIALIIFAIALVMAILSFTLVIILRRTSRASESSESPSPCHRYTESPKLVHTVRFRAPRRSFRVRRHEEQRMKYRDDHNGTQPTPFSPAQSKSLVDHFKRRSTQPSQSRPSRSRSFSTTSTRDLHTAPAPPSHSRTTIPPPASTRPSSPLSLQSQHLQHPSHDSDAMDVACPLPPKLHTRDRDRNLLTGQNTPSEASFPYHNLNAKPLPSLHPHPSFVTIDPEREKSRTPLPYAFPLPPRTASSRSPEPIRCPLS